MAGLRMTTLAAGFGAALAGGPEQADAQATELMLPHPDGEIAVDVSRVAYETQAQILEQLTGCLQEGFAFADEDGNGKIECDEQWDWRAEKAHCAEVAEVHFQTAASEARQAELREGIQLADAEQAELATQIASDRARAEAARREMQELTDDLINGARNEGS